MAISPLTDYVALSPNHYSGRAYHITKITIHHMAGDLTVEGCGSVFSSTSRQASSNYGVGSDGRIGCYVDEANAAWTSADWDNDNRAVTIEVADYDTDAWSPTSAAYESTIALCVDICQRNGIDQLVYTGGPDGTMTEHLMFAATGCPGPWWHERMAQVTDEINARLNGEDMISDDDCKRIADQVWRYELKSENGYEADAGIRLRAIDDKTQTSVDLLGTVKSLVRKLVKG